jgi:uncharacterized glyoxalase superfamily protein PhnB
MTAKELLDYYGRDFGAKGVTVQRISEEEYLEKRDKSGIVQRKVGVDAESL